MISSDLFFLKSHLIKFFYPNRTVETNPHIQYKNVEYSSFFFLLTSSLGRMGSQVSWGRKMKNGFVEGPSPKSEYKVNTRATRPVQEKTKLKKERHLHGAHPHTFQADNRENQPEGLDHIYIGGVLKMDK